MARLIGINHVALEVGDVDAALALYARLFESAEVSEASEGVKGSRVSGATAARELPPSQSIPVEEFFAGRVKTAELAAQPSVTEHTTRSLRSD